MSEIDILIVDDEPYYREMLEHALSLTYKVLAVGSGKEALVTLDSLEPGIVLLDIEMPEMDGYSVCQEIVQKKPWHDTSVVFISAHNTLEERLKGYELGAVDFISKPLDISEVKAKLEALQGLRHKWKMWKKHGKKAESFAVQAYSEVSWHVATVDFQRNVFSAGGMHEIASLLLDTINDLAVKCVIELRGNTKMTLHSDGHEASPLVQEVMDALKKKGETADYKDYRCYNKRHVSILVRKQDQDTATDSANLDRTLIALAETAEAAIVCFIRKSLLNTIVEEMTNLMTSMVIHRQRMERGVNKLTEDSPTMRGVSSEAAGPAQNLKVHLTGLAADSEKLDNLLQQLKHPLAGLNE